MGKRRKTKRSKKRTPGQEMSTLNGAGATSKEKEQDLSENENLEGKQNPLDIPEILATVASNVSNVEDLKSLRALNSKWRDETLKNWRKSAVLVINRDSYHVIAKAFDDSAYTGLSEKAKEKMELEVDPFQFRRLPFTQYRWKGELRGEYERCLIQSKCINPNATYLDAGHCLIQESQRELHQLDNIYKNIPKVTELVLAPLRIPSERFGFGFAELMRYRVHSPNFVIVPNVTSLTISNPKLNSSGFTVNGREPLFKSDHNVNLDNIAYWFFIRRLPNLKTLRVMNGEASCAIFKALAKAARQNTAVINLDSIQIVACEPKDYFTEWSLCLSDYLRSVPNPTTRELRLSMGYLEIINRNSFIHPIRRVQNTLVKLELELNCEVTTTRFQVAAFLQPELCLHGCDFPNLTHFKLLLDYKQIRKNLPTIDLNHLRKMPKLREFHHGPKRFVKVCKFSYTFEKVNITSQPSLWMVIGEQLPRFDPVLTEQVVAGGLSDLNIFHIYEKLTKPALNLLAKWTQNLQVFEGIFDIENIEGVELIWPNLKKLILLPGSNVPKRVLNGCSRPGLSILDHSRQFSSAKDPSN